MANDRYVGTWLNGMDERTARWYLKEGIPCFIVREISSRERAKLTALETMIDFAAGSSASSIHWNVNKYDTLAIEQGDLLITDTTRSFDPGWIWPAVRTDNEELKRPKEVVNYEPPPLTTIVVDADRIPWIKPPPVQKAEQSLPGVPSHERKKWRKFVEQHHPENTFLETSPKRNPDYMTYTRFDRERRWQILFLKPLKAPPGCVSDIDIFGQPCPDGTYKDMAQKRKRVGRPAWIYNRMDPKTNDLRKEAPVPRPEDLPLIHGPPLPAPGSNGNDDDDDDWYYPNLDFGAPVVPSAPAALNLPHGAPLPFGANIAFMWSPSGNTLSPVLLQGNGTVLPYQMPLSGPTPSALLPWPVAVALPVSSTDPAPSIPEPFTSASAAISDDVQPALMSRMSNSLAARMRDPVPSIPLSSRLSDLCDLSSQLSDAPGVSLADRLEVPDPWTWNSLRLLFP
ncbi:uncharacterized protein LACBIDRAFT_334083 [Laccaria bicolor S238N-H82]|uniref:Predicted protein n=1 Tax=Laccaria bicolor (strain S238N-H82 / ATCC MYA-4686) TaxID=486041 RepID=B0DY13_LACBS|nr:uncharacterized protein LACBIDRAFT_334083 [Laccaria bicolor S238N-H82]EDR00561.1 predicted protein [Laccaria bicolor S238N-H82]|eukprot:XP_001888788.1 predicted protein [Laccaria bicolor S238N-H82]